jgi:hypothetical protein
MDDMTKLKLATYTLLACIVAALFHIAGYDVLACGWSFGSGQAHMYWRLRLDYASKD